MQKIKKIEEGLRSYTQQCKWVLDNEEHSIESHEHLTKAYYNLRFAQAHIKEVIKENESKRDDT